MTSRAERGLSAPGALVVILVLLFLFALVSLTSPKPRSESQSFESLQVFQAARNKCEELLALGDESSLLESPRDPVSRTYFDPPRPLLNAGAATALQDGRFMREWTVERLGAGAVSGELGDGRLGVKRVTVAAHVGSSPRRGAAGLLDRAAASDNPLAVARISFLVVDPASSLP